MEGSLLNLLSPNCSFQAQYWLVLWAYGPRNATRAVFGFHWSDCECCCAPGDFLQVQVVPHQRRQWTFLDLEYWNSCRPSWSWALPCWRHLNFLGQISIHSIYLELNSMTPSKFAQMHLLYSLFCLDWPCRACYFVKLTTWCSLCPRIVAFERVFSTHLEHHAWDIQLQLLNFWLSLHVLGFCCLLLHPSLFLITVAASFLWNLQNVEIFHMVLPVLVHLPL